MKKTSGDSGGFLEVEFDPDCFFDFLDLSPEIIRQIRQRFAGFEALRHFDSWSTRTDNYWPAPSHLRIDRNYARFVGDLPAHFWSSLARKWKEAHDPGKIALDSPQMCT